MWLNLVPNLDITEPDRLPKNKQKGLEWGTPLTRVCIRDTLTGMKRINITIDEETAKVLEGKVNKSETIRQALLIHNEGVSTDTLAGMRESFHFMANKMKDLEKRFNEQYEMVERLYNMINELINR